MIKLLFSDPPCYLDDLALLAAVLSVRALCSSLAACAAAIVQGHLFSLCVKTGSKHPCSVRVCQACVIPHPS